MNLGARMAAWAGGVKRYDVQDYAGWGTSDLTAMFDGIRNVGATADHDSNATSWTELVSNTNVSIVTGSFDANSYYKNTVGFGVSAFVNTSEFVEICFVCNDNGVANTRGQVIVNPGSISRWIMFCGNNNTNIGIQIGNGTFQIPKANYDIQYTAYGSFTDHCSHVNGEEYVGDTVTGLRFSDSNNYFVSPRNDRYTFTGHIYAIRFYNRALTAAEIAANYAIDKARFGLT